jgi:LPXTG-site transpeptidase (sortase) family protein
METLDPHPSTQPSARKQRRWTWQRIVADVIILAGVCLLLYLPALWVWAWRAQKGLVQQLEQSHPIMKSEAAGLFRDDMIVVDPSTTPLDATETAVEMDAMRRATAQAEAAAARRAEVQAFRDAAMSFAAGVQTTEGEPLGKIIIPKIDLDYVIVEGVTLEDMKSGPGHWPETPFPGMGGNFILSGHRNMYGWPFFKLDKLVVGDTIEILLPYVAATYEVTRSLIVKPDQVEVVAQRGVEEISLTTCDPPFTARNRLVIQGKLVEYKLLPTSPPTS